MDTRQKLEADIRQWLDSRLIGNEVFETIISWLDRQANITMWEDIDLTDELQARVDGLQAKIDRQREELNKKNVQVQCLIAERDTLEDMTEQLSEEVDNQRINYTIAFARAEKAEDALADLEKTHMRLPVDADGVPIRIGDTMERVCAEVPGTFIVGLIGADGHCMDDETSFFIASECRHVKPDTVESLLEEFHSKLWSDDEEQMALLEEYAERIRKAVGQ